VIAVLDELLHDLDAKVIVGGDNGLAVTELLLVLEHPLTI
jgi:hypothetical protein